MFYFLFMNIWARSLDLSGYCHMLHSWARGQTLGSVFSSLWLAEVCHNWSNPYCPSSVTLLINMTFNRLKTTFFANILGLFLRFLYWIQYTYLSTPFQSNSAVLWLDKTFMNFWSINITYYESYFFTLFQIDIHYILEL